MKKNKTKRASERETRASPRRGGLDFHRSAPEAVPCLLSVERRCLRRFAAIHEMACGDGALVKPLRHQGFKVIATDIVDRKCPGAAVCDFTAVDKRSLYKLHRGVFGLHGRVAGLTNPPFNRAEEFIIKACEVYDYVAMLLRFRYLAPQHFCDELGVRDVGGRPIWERTRIPLARVIVPYARFAMMHRDGYRGPKLEGGMTDFAWFIWQRGHRGEARIVRAPKVRP